MGFDDFPIDYGAESKGRTPPALGVGGSEALARALIRDIEQHGGTVRTGVTVKSIEMRNGKAAAVHLASGERIEARAWIASGLKLRQTFVALLNAGDDLRNRAEAFDLTELLRCSH